MLFKLYYKLDHILRGLYSFHPQNFRCYYHAQCGGGKTACPKKKSSTQCPVPQLYQAFPTNWPLELAQEVDFLNQQVILPHCTVVMTTSRWKETSFRKWRQTACESHIDAQKQKTSMKHLQLYLFAHRTTQVFPSFTCYTETSRWFIKGFLPLVTAGTSHFFTW